MKGFDLSVFTLFSRHGLSSKIRHYCHNARSDWAWGQGAIQCHLPFLSLNGFDCMVKPSKVSQYKLGHLQWPSAIVFP